jgi:hypothetical protein
MLLLLYLKQMLLSAKSTSIKVKSTLGNKLLKNKPIISQGNKLPVSDHFLPTVKGNFFPPVA